MLQEERIQLILSEVNRKGAAKLTELAQLLNTSESTVRRDIVQLDKIGKLKRVFGGAVATEHSLETLDEDMSFKSSVNVQKKRRIAEYAATLINDNDVVFIDGGSTTERMIEFLSNKTVTYMTNGIGHAHLMAQKGLHVELIPGRLKNITMSIVGAEAVNYVRKFNFTKAFVGTNGVEKSRGLTTPDMDEASIKGAVIDRAYVSFILADSSKFGRVSTSTFADLKQVCIITDRLEDDSFREIAIIKEVLD